MHKTGGDFIKRPMVFAALVTVYIALCMTAAGKIYLLWGLLVMTAAVLVIVKRTGRKWTVCLSFLFSLISYGIISVRSKPASFDSVIQQKTQKSTVTGTVCAVEQKDGYDCIILKNTTVSIQNSDKTENQKERAGKILVYIMQNVKSAVHTYSDKGGVQGDGKTVSTVEFAPGDMLLVSGTLKCFETSRNEGGFDSRMYYKSIGIHYKMTAEDVTVLTRKRQTAGYLLSEFRLKIKEVYEQIGTKEKAGLYSSIVLGDKSSLDGDIKKLYQRNGIAHLLAISGLHISLVGMALYRLLRRAGTSYVFSFAAGTLFITGYVLMTGNALSGLRALVMCLLMMYAQVLGRTYDMLSALSTAAVMFIWNNPYVLYNSGFLLSFCAIIGIAVVLPALKRVFLPDRPQSNHAEKRCFIDTLRDTVKASFLTSFSVTAATLPVILNCYYEFPLYSVFLNLLVIPLMPLVMLCSVSAGVTGLFCKPAGVFLLGTAHFILEFYEVLCRTAGKLPYARIVTGKPKLWQCVVYLLVLALFVALSHFPSDFWQKLLFNATHKKREGAAHFNRMTKSTGNTEPKNTRTIESEKTTKGECAVELKKSAENTKTVKYSKIVKKCELIFLVVAIMIIMLPKKPSFEIDMLDVGQGDGIYMMTPEGETYLFDGGSSDEKNLAQNTLVPFLKSKGVARIDYALVSHTDTDHISGIMELMQGDEITVGAVLLPEALKNCDDANYIKFIKIAQDCNIPVWHVKTGDFVGNSQVTVQCLHPEISYHTDSVNDISAVYRIDYGEFSMLMTGDAGMNVENELLENGVLSPVTILKTGHHGSKSASSEAFLEEIRPQAALISCGVNNRYHHPSEEVIQRLKKMDIQTKVTAQCGQITVKSDGKTYRLMQWQ